MSKSIGDLPLALEAKEEFWARIDKKRPAVFLDYDGTLTPIVDRPENAVMAPEIRDIVRRLAERCPVCIVSGRDRPDIEALVGIDGLIFAGSHGFDIASPDGHSIQKEHGAEFAHILDQAKVRLHEVMDPIKGALIEPKKASVAAHYRLVAEGERHKVKDVVDEILADYPDKLKVTPGKMVYEIQPKVDWDKGRAVLYLLKTLGLDAKDTVPFYFGDDHTDEHAFEALAGRGVGVFVGDTDDPEAAGRTTSADFRVKNQDECAKLLDSLAR